MDDEQVDDCIADGALAFHVSAPGDLPLQESRHETERLLFVESFQLGAFFRIVASCFDSGCPGCRVDLIRLEMHQFGSPVGPVQSFFLNAHNCFQGHKRRMQGGEVRVRKPGRVLVCSHIVCCLCLLRFLAGMHASRIRTKFQVTSLNRQLLMQGRLSCKRYCLQHEFSDLLADS